MERTLYWIDLGLLTTGALVAALWLVVWFARGRDPLADAPERPNRLEAIPVWLCLVAYVFAGTVGMSLGGRFVPAGLSEKSRELCAQIIGTNVGALVSILVCAAVARHCFAQRWRGLGIGRRPVWRDFIAAVPVCIAGLSICTGIAWVTEKLMHLALRDFHPPEHSVFSALHDGTIPVRIQMMASFGALIAAPLAEELMFRGILQTSVGRLVSRLRGSASTPPPLLPIGAGTETAPAEVASVANTSLESDKTGEAEDLLSPAQYASNLPRRPRHECRWVAVGVVGVIFGAMHGPTPQHVPALMVFGCILGYVYERTGSLVLPILVHMLFNGKSLLWDALLH